MTGNLLRVLDEINDLDLNNEFQISIVINDASNHDLPNFEN